MVAPMVNPALVSLLADCLRSSDRIVVAQATSEPIGLVTALFDLAGRLEGLEAFCGFSLNPAWLEDLPSGLRVATYCGMGTISGQVARGKARVIPFSMSQLTAALRSRALSVDAVLVQVSPADGEGYHSLGLSADYIWDAIKSARVVIAEVNSAVPITRNACRLHQSQLIVAQQCDRALPQLARDTVGEVASAIGRKVAALVPDGATIQLGIGKLSEAIALELRDRRGLKVRSGMVGDWLGDLVAVGAIDTFEEGSSLASLAVGSSDFYRKLSSNDFLGFAQPENLVVPIQGSPFMAINSAIEVDLRGQVNAEFLGGRYIGASSGQPDYFRAARGSEGGLAILAIPASNERGDKSRIVSRIGSAYVTTAQSDLDVIVTEHGVADLRATDFAERRKRISAIARPDLRDGLMREVGAPGR